MTAMNLPQAVAILRPADTGEIGNPRQIGIAVDVLCDVGPELLAAAQDALGRLDKAEVTDHAAEFVRLKNAVSKAMGAKP